MVRPGRGAWFEAPETEGPVALRTSRTQALADALIATGFPFKARERIPEHLAQVDRVLRRTSGVRRCGAAALDLCYLAQGRVDGFWELVLSVWDVAGGMAILAEAGGRVTRLDGSAVTLAPGDVLAANGPGLHAALARVLHATRPASRDG